LHAHAAVVIANQAKTFYFIEFRRDHLLKLTTATESANDARNLVRSKKPLTRLAVQIKQRILRAMIHAVWSTFAASVI
jgi:hypothetical protein